MSMSAGASTDASTQAAGHAENMKLREDEYRQLETFITRTPRGRAFLREHARRSSSMAVNEVYDLVHGLRESWNEHTNVANATKHLEVLRRELQDMSASISQARREIASLRPKDENSDRILSATNELDQIVLSTERASIEILNAAERIMELTGRLRAAHAPDQICDDIDSEVTAIFTACSFQDLTGQRTTKVVNALRYIEQRIVSMMNIWGLDSLSQPAAVIPDRPDDRPDAHLLHGPSIDGIDQGEIDRLLNGEPPSAPPAPPVATLPPPSRPAPTPVVEEEEAPTPQLNQSAIDDLFP